MHDALTEVHLVSEPVEIERFITVSMERGNSGRPRFTICREYVSELLNMGLSVKYISKLVGVSRWTLQRRMNDWAL